MLKFIGVGSAFNTKYVENSAFIIENNSLLIIDCGCRVFYRIMELKLLKGVENIYVAITHTHPDHVGSLGSLLFYVYYVLGRKITLLFPNKEFIVDHLRSIGIAEEFYNLDSNINICLADKFSGNLCIEFMKNTHDAIIPTFSLIISKSNVTTYYSGDSKVISRDIVRKLEDGSIDFIYQDTCSLEAEFIPHMSVSSLEKAISFKFREKVFCMHLDERFDCEKVKSLGFNVAKQINEGI